MTFHQHAWRAALSAAVLVVSAPLLVVASAHWHDGRPVLLAAGSAGWPSPSSCPSSPSRAPAAASSASPPPPRSGAPAPSWPAPSGRDGRAGALRAPGPRGLAGRSGPHRVPAAPARPRRGGRPAPPRRGGPLRHRHGCPGWDVFGRAGHVGDGWWQASASLVVLIASFVAASAVVLAVEHGALRLACFGLGSRPWPPRSRPSRPRTPPAPRTSPSSSPSPVACCSSLSSPAAGSSATAGWPSRRPLAGSAWP